MDGVSVSDPETLGGGGGISNMKYKKPYLAAIFLWLVFTGHVPPRIHCGYFM